MYADTSLVSWEQVEGQIDKALEFLSLVPPPPNQPPTAIFSASATYVAPGQAVVFNPQGSSDVDGQIVAYDWNFGDGQKASQSTPATVSHGFVAGNYFAQLTVTDDAGATGQFGTLVCVALPPQTILVYDEAVNGDLPTFSDDRPPGFNALPLAPLVPLQIGLNEVRGHGSGIPPYDFDSFRFEVPAGAKLMDILVSYARTPSGPMLVNYDLYLGNGRFFGTRIGQGGQFGVGCGAPESLFFGILHPTYPLPPGIYNLDNASLSAGDWSWSYSFLLRVVPQ